MNSNKVIVEIHNAAVNKVAENIKITGNKKLAVEIGNAIIKYGNAWTNGLSDDGTLDKTEIDIINSAFLYIVEKYIPSIDNAAVGIAYNGVTNRFLKLFGIYFKGLKSHLNDWFKLGLVCLSAIVIVGCSTGICITLNDSTGATVGNISIEEAVWPVLSIHTGPTFRYWMNKDSVDCATNITLDASASITNSTSCLGIYNDNSTKSLSIKMGNKEK